MTPRGRTPAAHLLHASRHGVVLRLEAVHVLAELPVNVFGEDAHVAEERAQHGKLLLQQLHLLLHPLVLPGQDLDPLLRLPGAELGHLARLPHRHVVPLSPPGRN